MTNLLEKVLLTAFGMFTLIIFMSFIFPYWDQINNYETDFENNYENYSRTIEQFDQGILFIIENSDKIYQKAIDYPKNLNISTDKSYVKYEFFLNDVYSYIIYQYDTLFLQIEYKNILSQMYQLKIFFNLGLLEIHIL